MSSEQAQQLIGQAQAYQQQLQNVMMQREALKVQLQEIDNAREELAKVNAGQVYKMAGPVLIKAEAAEVAKELNDRKELLEVRMKALEKGEKKIQEKVDEIRSRITKDVSVDDVTEHEAAG